MKLGDIKLDKDKYYFLCLCGFGDTILISGFRDAICKRLNSQIILLIRSSHKIVMDLYGITNYIVVDVESWENYVELSDQCPYPRKGEIYCAHPLVHNEFPKEIFEKKYMDGRKTFFNLHQNTPFVVPKMKSFEHQNIKQKLSKIAPLDKIILFNPDARCLKQFDVNFWERLAQKKKAEGFEIITNALSPSDTVSGTHFLDLSIEEAFYVATHCHSVYALRSGFCDLIAYFCENLTVYYPDYRSFNKYNLYDLYGLTKKEIIIPEKIDPLSVQKTTAVIKILGIPLLKLKKTMKKCVIKLFGIKIISISYKN